MEEEGEEFHGRGEQKAGWMPATDAVGGLEARRTGP
jgi:hypothetical protein